MTDARMTSQRTRLSRAEMVDGLHRAGADLLRRSHLVKPNAIAVAVNEVLHPLGLRATVFLVDHEQRTLRPLPQAHEPAPHAVPVEGTIAGRAFATVTPLVAGRAPARIWFPILNGTSRLGVLEIALPKDFAQAMPEVREGGIAIARLVGHLIEARDHQGDTLEQVRRTKPMSVATELLWHMLPPQTFACPELVVSGVLQPAYEVGGDAFDYSVDAGTARLAIMDAVGHGLDAALTCATALAASRSARRAGEDINGMAHAADEALASQWSDARFVTAVFAELDLATGRLGCLNAGHPPPVLLRNGRAGRNLRTARRQPLGFAEPPIILAQDQLEPGDLVLLYTDGVTEARSADGSFFGLRRLLSLAEVHAASGLPTAEILRRLSHAVYDHQHGELQDDATLVLAEWSESAAGRSVP